MVDEPTAAEVDAQIRGEQEDILRGLHRELKSVDRRVTRSRARALSIPLRPAALDPDTARRESIRIRKLPIQRKRANVAVRLLHTDVPDPDEEDTAVAATAPPAVAGPEFDEERNVPHDGGIRSSDDSSSSSSDDDL